VASENNDPQLADFVESEFLGEQVKVLLPLFGLQLVTCIICTCSDSEYIMDYF